MDATHPLLLQTRRHFFRDCAVGLGALALTDLLRGAPAPSAGFTPARQTHFPAKAKSVIFLFMAGGPSQLEMWDWKPKLTELSGQPIPESFVKGKRFAFMDTFSKERPKLLG